MVVRLTKPILEGICLSEDQKFGFVLTIKIAPLVLLAMVDMYILEHFISVDNVLRFKIFLGIDRSLIAKSQRVVMQRPAKRFP